MKKKIHNVVNSWDLMTVEKMTMEYELQVALKLNDTD